MSIFVKYKSYENLFLVKKKIKSTTKLKQFFKTFKYPIRIGLNFFGLALMTGNTIFFKKIPNRLSKASFNMQLLSHYNNFKEILIN